MTAMDSQDLIDVIHKYGLPVDSSTIQAALEHEEQGRLLSEWAKSYLTTDTLLTKDELNSYVNPDPNLFQSISLAVAELGADTARYSETARLKV